MRNLSKRNQLVNKLDTVHKQEKWLTKISLPLTENVIVNGLASRWYSQTDVNKMRVGQCAFPMMKNWRKPDPVRPKAARTRVSQILTNYSAYIICGYDIVYFYFAILFIYLRVARMTQPIWVANVFFLSVVVGSETISERKLAND